MAILAVRCPQTSTDQNEFYLELMTLSGGGAIAQIGKIAGLTDDFEQTRNALIANPEHLIRDMIAPVAPISDREDQDGRRI